MSGKSNKLSFSNLPTRNWTFIKNCINKFRYLFIDKKYFFVPICTNVISFNLPKTCFRILILIYVESKSVLRNPTQVLAL